MTALTVPVRPAEDGRLRPLPWRRMAWVSWRHHRIALGGVAVFLGALALWLWISGLQLHHAYAAAIACHPASSAACQNLIATFQSTSVILKGGFVLQPVPALIGAFVGAPMLAREIETGTFRYAWTQGFGGRRWTLAKLVLVGVAVAAVAGAFGVLVSWYCLPAVSRHRQRDRVFLRRPRRCPPGCSTCAVSRLAPGRWLLSRWAPSACSSAGSSLRSSPPSPPTPVSPCWQGTCCASTT